MIEEELATIMCEYINVQNGMTWTLQWGVLTRDTLCLYSSEADRQSKAHPNVTVDVKQLQVRPVDHRDDHRLAFQLADSNGMKLVVEPLNILDMGRWINGLFVAIRGTEVPVTDNVHDTQECLGSETTEVIRYTVDVKHIANMFENLATSRAAEPKPVRRRSTPSFSATAAAASDIISENEEVATASPEILQAEPKKSDVQLTSATENDEHMKNPEVRQSTDETAEDKVQIIKCSEGPYRALDADVLANMTNPFLVKRRVVRQKEQIKKLEKTIENIVLSIERQKHLMTETREILQELQEGASEQQERDQVLKLESECFYLQKQIENSEQNIHNYRELIRKIESELVESEATIQQNENQEPLEENKDRKDVADDHHNVRDDVVAIDNGIVNHNGIHKSPPSSLSDNEDEDEDLRHPEMNKDTPDWAKHACLKAKRAYKILAKEGIL